MSRKKPPAAAVSARREAMPVAITGGAFSPDERRLSFGDRWAYAPAFEQSDHLKINRATRFSSTASFALRVRGDISIPLIRRPRRSRRKSPRPMRGMWISRFRRQAERTARSGARCMAVSGASFSIASPASSRRSRGTRRARITGRRQDDQGKPRRRSAPGRGAFLLLRGLGGQARIRVSRPFATFVRCGRAKSSRGISRF